MASAPASRSASTPLDKTRSAAVSGTGPASRPDSRLLGSLLAQLLPDLGPLTLGEVALDRYRIACRCRGIPLAMRLQDRTQLGAPLFPCGRALRLQRPWHGHLGDGTSDIFYDTDQVLYWSMHQYPAFPGHGFVDEIGTGKGKGFTVNIPLPPGSADDILEGALQYFLPVVEQFQPDVVAVSAGFDAHQYDLLLDLKASANFFYKAGKEIRARFSHVFATLEGGYNVDEMPKCLYNFMAGVNEEPVPYPEDSTSSGMRVLETYEIYVNAIIANLKSHWKF